MGIIEVFVLSMVGPLFQDQVQVKINVAAEKLKEDFSFQLVRGFRLPHARTGDVLIVAHWRLNTLAQYFTWFGKSLTSTGEVHFIRDREMIQ